jgi:hypothetical protein
MRKKDELANPNSCLNRAKDNEWLFVLKASDICSPGAVRDWVKRRLKKKRNQPGDAQIIEALQCAQSMEEQKEKGEV